MLLDSAKQYECVVRIRNHDLTTRWSVNSFFLVVNSGGLGFVTTTLTSPELKSFFLGAALIGFLLSVSWWFTILYIRKWMDYWNGCLIKIEEAVEKEQRQPDSAGNIVRVFEEKQFRQAKRLGTFTAASRIMHKYFGRYYTIPKYRIKTSIYPLYKYLFIRRISYSGVRMSMNIVIWTFILIRAALVVLRPVQRNAINIPDSSALTLTCSKLQR